MQQNQPYGGMKRSSQLMNDGPNMSKRPRPDTGSWGAMGGDGRTNPSYGYQQQTNTGAPWYQDQSYASSQQQSGYSWNWALSRDDRIERLRNELFPGQWVSVNSFVYIIPWLRRKPPLKLHWRKQIPTAISCLIPFFFLPFAWFPQTSIEKQIPRRNLSVFCIVQIIEFFSDFVYLLSLWLIFFLCFVRVCFFEPKVFSSTRPLDNRKNTSGEFILFMFQRLKLFFSRLIIRVSSHPSEKGSYLLFIFSVNNSKNKRVSFLNGGEGKEWSATRHLEDIGNQLESLSLFQGTSSFIIPRTPLVPCWLVTRLHLRISIRRCQIWLNNSSMKSSSMNSKRKVRDRIALSSLNEKNWCSAKISSSTIDDDLSKYKQRTHLGRTVIVSKCMYIKQSSNSLRMSYFSVSIGFLFVLVQHNQSNVVWPWSRSWQHFATLSDTSVAKFVFDAWFYVRCCLSRGLFF